MTDVRIRRARPNEIDVIASLDRDLFAGDEPMHRSDVLWTAMNRGSIVGYAAARVWRFAGEHALVLTRAGVARGHRRRGIGRRLVRARLRYGRAIGCTEAWTYTSHDNPASSNNLIACGFRLWIPSHWDGDDPLALDLERELAFLYWRRIL